MAEGKVKRLRGASPNEMPIAATHGSDLAFLQGGGTMGALMRAHDWGTTALGPSGAWPQSLRSVLSACLNSPMLGAVLWGPDLLLLYNDAYALSLAERHPGALGRPVAEVWGETWDRVSASFYEALATGRGFSQTDVALPIRRHGRSETTWWDFTATPIRGEDGAIVGLLNQGVETTERIRTAAAFQATERRNRQVLDSASDFAIVATDIDGRVTLWNEGAHRVLGWTEAEMLGEPIDRFFTPEDVAAGRVEIEMRRALETGHGNDERWHRRKGGERFWAVGEMTVLRDEADAAIGFVKVLRDRTEQRRTEEARRADAEFLSSVLESSSDCIKVLDLDAKLLFMSESGQRVMEVSDFEAIQGCPWPDFWHGPGREQAKAAVDAARAGGIGQFQGPAATMAGTPRHWDVRVTPILGADGRPEKLLSVSRDVTATQQAEAAMRESEAHWRGLFERLQEGFILGELVRDGSGTAVDWRYLDVNQAWSDLVDIAPCAAIGRTIREVFPGIEDAWIDEMAVVVDADQPATFTRQVGVLDRWYEGRAFRIGGDRFAVLFLEITERQAVEERLRASEARLRDLNETLEAQVQDRTRDLLAKEDQLRQSQKMEAVGQLTGGLAHDFNNLLAGITGALDLIKKRLAQGRAGDVSRYLDMAATSASRAAALTHRLLAFSRRQTLDPKPTDVDHLVAGMVDMVRQTIGPGIGIHVVNGPDVWAALVDPNQLENALLNLCINSRDAMPDGGRLTIETENCWIDSRNALARDFEAGPYLKLSVSDTGVGMPPEVIVRAFDPFFTTKPLGQGTGLGLSMIYGFVKQSGGQVRIHSQPGAGTTVALYLPRHDGATADAGAPREDVAARPRAERGETVLVVDDEPAVRMLVADVLSDLGYVLVEAADGAAGLQILQSDIRVDLLVTDVGLPGGMNGRQVADAARVLRPGLKVLFITGYAENAVVGNGHLDPGMAVLTKPFAMDDLAATIRSLIEG